nr:hypothetical protein Iba_chr10aCG15390 [Ipomoea batatas]
MFGRSASSIATSRAVLTSFCIALRPLLKAQIRALQDPSPGLLGRLKLALELLDPLVPLGKRLLKGRYFSTMDLVSVLSPGEEISDGVGHLRSYRPGIAMIAALAGGVRGGQGQPGRDQGFGAGVRRLRGLGLLRPEADFLCRGQRTGGDRKTPHSS